MKIIPRIYFNGNCNEAIERYKSALGATVDYLMTYGSAAAGASEDQDLIMNAQIDISGNKFHLADRAQMDVFSTDQISFTVFAESPQQVKIIYQALSEGGKILMEPAETFFSPCHCSLIDPFGITWQVNCPKG